MNRYSKVNDSSSSSSSDELSFILEESSNDEHILKYVLDNDNDKSTLELIMKLKQAREEMRASTSLASRRLRKKKRFIRRDHEEAHERIWKIILLRTLSIMRPIFTADLGCKDTFSFTL